VGNEASSTCLRQRSYSCFEVLKGFGYRSKRLKVPDCPLCGGACVGADLAPLLDSRLRWLWEQVAAAADRRNDPALVEGTLKIRVPVLDDAGAAVGHLLGERALTPGRSCNVNLHRLTLNLRVRGSQLTPGAIAAHAVDRPVATKSKAEAERATQERELQELLVHLAGSFPEGAATKIEPERLWPALKRAGWVTRLVAAKDPTQLLRTAVTVVAGLPPNGVRMDRHRLASDWAGSPHALDEGTPLSGLVLAILLAAGRVRPRLRPRVSWAEAGVDCDDLTGGLVSVGVVPVGWTLPAGAAVTLPPRELISCRWPIPGEKGQWVFVTENPSVAMAAADIAASCPGVRLLCTNGTLSPREIAAISRLAGEGWRIAVRADFDEAGLSHVAAFLSGVPGAMPWRMRASDYMASLVYERENPGARLTGATVPEASWDPQLSAAMRKEGIAAYEEALLHQLLDDLACGQPDAYGVVTSP